MSRLAIIASLLLPLCIQAQADRSALVSGNRSYRQQQYAKAAEQYQKALGLSPGNGMAGFNLGNALFRDKRNADAEKAYDGVIAGTRNARLARDAWYNKGVSLSAGQKLDESITAYKNALRIDPTDTLARDNLQRAMNELKRRKEQDQQQKKKEEQPKMNKQQLQQLLQALQDQEKMLQQKINHSRVPSPSQPEKDW
jgi:Ca-activated chloride channel family protein